MLLKLHEEKKYYSGSRVIIMEKKGKARLKFVKQGISQSLTL